MDAAVDMKTSTIIRRGDALPGGVAQGRAGRLRAGGCRGRFRTTHEAGEGGGDIGGRSPRAS